MDGSLRSFKARNRLKQPTSVRSLAFFELIEYDCDYLIIKFKCSFSVYRWMTEDKAVF